MSSIFVQHQFGLLLFLFTLLLIAFSNLRVLQRLGSHRVPSYLPRLSLLVPARNEEINIGACVSSLLSQDYPDFELIVLDDESTDATRAILSEYSAADLRMSVIDGSPLPGGWLGKNWACHQLAREATGELLLFVDADTRHHSGVLQAAVAALESEHADFLSAIPREEVVTWPERLIVPVIPWSIISFVPLIFANRSRATWISAAIGQFMLFRRSAYDQIGGHASVRSSTVDDIYLARRIKSLGLRWALVDATSHVTCRMYRNGGEVVRGVSRTLYSVFENKLILHLFVWSWLVVAFVEPIIVLTAALAGSVISSLSIWLAAVAVLVSVVLWLSTYSRLQIPRYLALFYPVTIFFSALLAIRSAIATRFGRVTWRDRHIPAAS